MAHTHAQQTRETLAKLYDNPDQRVADLRKFTLDEKTTSNQQAVFQALNNKDRLKLLAALRDGEKCACELQVVLTAPQSTVSTHLTKLRESGLIQRRRKGKWSYFRLADKTVLDILNLAATLPGDQ